VKESKDPEIVTATREEIDELLTLARTSFPTKQYELLEGVLGTFVYVMLLTALRPSCTCDSIHARCGSHAEMLAARGATSGSTASAGGRGGGICPSGPGGPVATPGEFASRSRRRMVLRSTPVRRSISRWLAPPRRNVAMVMRKCAFKTFTPCSSSR
jgi:hypothetical protein